MQPIHAHEAIQPGSGLAIEGLVQRRWNTRIAAAMSAVTGVLTGIAPHVLHHIAPIAGAAILTGAFGSVLFGVLGIVMMVPMLRRLYRHFHSWIAPGLALVLFAGMFTISTVWIGPAIRGDEDTTNVTQPVDPHGH